ncbi:hypothetical protein FE257_010786 [Aspergillus nanangensis]|uniref:Uncharacterized protein n=1 Tax=Aspergillus nanangensis TaxID=2582783 RepID=A0AAD4GX54_ASPNN|nr:hypothetical protein FE257_010786 [Aspergillus nanangensis]
MSSDISFIAASFNQGWWVLTTDHEGIDAQFSSVFHWSGVMDLHGTPIAPLFVYKAVGDELSLVADTDDLVSKYCAQGANIEYIRDWVGGHVSKGVTGPSSAMNWLRERLEG